MSHSSTLAEAGNNQDGLSGLVKDWSTDKQTYHVPWGKAMMWIFLVSDTFIFSCFLVGYMTVRVSTTDPWPLATEVFALSFFGSDPIPLILIALMTFVLITSSGTMALAVNYGYRRDRKKTVLLMIATAALGATFVGMQAFEWSKLIGYGVRPWSNPWGAPQFGSVFYMVTGFHGLHVSAGVIYLLLVARKVWRGDYEKKGYEIVEITGLYWHFVDLVWVFIFAFFYLL
ncbi:bb3-type cytochrome oxidase subunit IV [Gammaproteobacteria bacterium LSUCC0112]|nr:bb3-type cytochrome oxidase subunit IV [Gammaproteobacteria bacterium LSUCC0112]